MSLFNIQLSGNTEQAKNTLLREWKNYCTNQENNPILAEIQEAQSVEELEKICRFLYSLSVLLEKVDIVGKRYDYSSYIEAVTNAIKANEAINGGANVGPGEMDLIRKYGLE